MVGALRCFTVAVAAAELLIYNQLRRAGVAQW
jgi:hypothetical protein